MPLVTLEDVREHLPQVQISEDSRPTEAAVEAWLAEVEAAVFATVQNLPPKHVVSNELCTYTYVFPVDPLASPVTAGILKDLVLHAVTARILRAMTYGIGDVTASGSKAAQDYYDQRIMWLADPNHPFSLPDAEILEQTCQTSWFSGLRAFGDTSGRGYRPRPTMRTIF